MKNDAKRANSLPAVHTGWSGVQAPDGPVHTNSRSQNQPADTYRTVRHRTTTGRSSPRGWSLTMSTTGRSGARKKAKWGRTSWTPSKLSPAHRTVRCTTTGRSGGMKQGSARRENCPQILKMQSKSYPNGLQTLQGLCLGNEGAIPNRSRLKPKVSFMDSTCPQSEAHKARTKDRGAARGSKHWARRTTI